MIRANCTMQTGVRKWLSVPADFINGLKEQINKIVIDVLSDNSNRRVTIMTEEDLKIF